MITATTNGVLSLNVIMLLNAILQALETLEIQLLNARTDTDFVLDALMEIIYLQLVA